MKNKQGSFIPQGDFTSQKGFTLIELLVVIAIIGLLASIVLVATSSARSKARDAARVSDIQEIQTALELYYNDNNQYPPSGGATAPNGGWSNDSDSSWTTLQGYLSPQYISNLPKDPLEDNNVNEWGGGAYHFSYYSLGYGCNQQWYMLVYQLETAKGIDPGVKACNGTYFQYGGSGANTTVKTVGAN